MNAPVDVPERSNDAGSSSVVLSSLSGAPLTLWVTASGDTKPLTEVRLAIAPDRPVVVGRSEGKEISYLDPAYRPTTILPGTGQTVLRHAGHGTDVAVSRGHFMLRQTAGGVMLVNGVPRRGGGIRAPLNGTWLLAPVRRPLAPEEEFLIASGTSAVLFLPNGSELRVDAA
ncbi:hypothetical protein J0H58_34675 [bacterium]|nr:hypothetical protein [bacterium]